MIQCDFFGKHIELVTKAVRAIRYTARRLRTASPFQLDLFIKRIPLGKSALARLKTGTRLKSPTTGLQVAFKFIKNGFCVFSFNSQLFSLSANDAALLEF